ncbi:hypothetical protein ACFL23_02295 [Patescibacteria group bacterium]
MAFARQYGACPPNWWGHASGPFDVNAVGQTGQGVRVSDGVDYSNWKVE